MKGGSLLSDDNWLPISFIFHFYKGVSSTANVGLELLMLSSFAHAWQRSLLSALLGKCYVRSSETEATLQMWICVPTVRTKMDV